MEATESNGSTTKAATPCPEKPQCHLKAGAAVAVIVAVVFILLRVPLLGDRVFLPFDSRLFAPYSGAAPEELLSQPGNMIYSDLPGWTMPERLVTIDMQDQGIAPLWTPYTMGGLPLLASLAYPIYAPLNLLLEAVPGLDPYKALGIQTFLNLVIAGVGMYLFLRLLSLHTLSCLLGAISLCASAWFVTHAYIPIFLNSAAWVPLIFWAAEKMLRSRMLSLPSLLLALFTGCSMLGGFPQATLIGLYGAGFWIFFSALFRRNSSDGGFLKKMNPIVAFVLAVAIGVGISLVQLLPATELKENSLRDADYPLSYYKEHPLQPPSLLGQFAPGLFGHPVDPQGGGGVAGNVQGFPTYRLFLDYNVQNNIMENALFIGVIPFFLAIGALARLRRRLSIAIFAGMAMLVLVIVLGTPLMDLCYRLLPGFSVGSPKRWLLLYSFALAGLAAFGMEGFTNQAEKRPGRIFTLILVCAGLGGIATLTVGFGPASRFISQWWMDRAQSLGIQDLSQERITDALEYLRKIAWPALGAILVLGISRVFHRIRQVGLLVPIVLIVATCAELLWFAEGFIVTQPREGQYPATGATDFINERVANDPTLGPFRVAPFNAKEVLLPDPAAVHGVQSVGGVSGLIPRRYGELCHALDPSLIEMEDPRFIGSITDEASLDSPLVDLLGIRFFAIGKEADLPAMQRHGFTPAYRNDGEMIALFENNEALPRAFVAFSCQWASRVNDSEIDKPKMKEEALARICAPDFDPRETVVLEIPFSEKYTPRMDSRGRMPEVRWEKYEPLELVLHAEMHDARGFLVLIDTWYPGWKAWVDDQPVPIERADYAFRAVFLKEGSHTVRFSYQPESFENGLLGSWIFLVLVGLWGCGLAGFHMRNMRKN